MVFRDQEDFIDRGLEFYKQWGSHFGRYAIFDSNAGHLCLSSEIPASTFTRRLAILRDTPRFTWSIGTLIQFPIFAQPS